MNVFIAHLCKILKGPPKQWFSDCLQGNPGLLATAFGAEASDYHFFTGDPLSNVFYTKF